MLSRALSLTIGLATNAQIRDFTNTQINYTQMHDIDRHKYTNAVWLSKWELGRRRPAGLILPPAHQKAPLADV